MTNGNVFKLAQPGTFIDLLTEVLRDGARSLLVHAVEAHVGGDAAGRRNQAEIAHALAMKPLYNGHFFGWIFHGQPMALVRGLILMGYEYRP